MKIINLLPKQKQQELHYEELFHSVLIAVVLTAAVLIAGLVTQIGARAYLSHQKNTQQSQIDQIKRSTNKQENNELKNKIRLVNIQMSDFKALADSTPSWSAVLLAFSSQVPEGVKINSFVADLETKKIIIIGQSPTREQVISLYNNISGDSKDFRDIDYPLENVAKPANVTFHFTFFIQDKLLQAAIK
jgi:Tfp pilus assembly protein PilN